MKKQTYTAVNDTKYMLTERFNRPFCDINKTNKDDGNMCWAACISNMVEFALPGRNTKTTFNYLKKKYRNKSGNIYHEFLSTFRSLGFSMENFLLIASFDYRKINRRMDLCIIGTLYQGRVVGINIIKSLTAKTGHGLTVYGFERNNSGIYIFYVDSENAMRKLYRERIKCKRGITRFATGEYKGYVIDIVYGLQIFLKKRKLKWP